MKNLLTEEFYRAIVENNPNGIIICDENFKIIYCNKQINSLTGFDFEQIENKNIDYIISPKKNDCPICQAKTDVVIEDKDFSHIGELKTQNNKTVTGQVQQYFQRHSELVSESHDFEMLKQVQHDVRVLEDADLLHKTIFVKINHNMTEISAKRLYLITIAPLPEPVCLNQAHLDFVSTVSHELRTPLTSIKGFADTLLTSHDRLSKEQRQRFLNIIKNQIDRLTRLVENLLTVSKLESTKSKSIFKVINLKSLIEPVVQIVQGKFPEHKFEILIEKNLPEIWTDSDKLEQVMTNLIDNAAKYSKEGTKVTVKAQFREGKPDFIQIKVIDQGIGIADNHLTKIFTKFSRIDNPLTREVQGTGLGLYITKTIVENMGGKIYAESSNEGSVFTVEMPAATIEKYTGGKFTEKI